MGDIVIFAKLATEMKPGSSPLRVARVRSLEAGSDGRVRSATLEYKTKPSKSYKTTIRPPDQLTIVATKEKVEDCVNVELPDTEPIENVSRKQPPPDLEDEFEPEQAGAGGVQNG